MTDPYLVSEVLGKDTELEKSIEGVYSKFNVVGTHMEGPPPTNCLFNMLLCNAVMLSASQCLLCFDSPVQRTFVQLLHAEGKPNIFTSHTDDYWRLIRKGVAPAFSPKNIRCVPQHTRHGAFILERTAYVSAVWWKLSPGKRNTCCAVPREAQRLLLQEGLWARATGQPAADQHSGGQRRSRGRS